MQGFRAVRPIPRLLLVIPLLWALIGSTAVFLLGVVQDLGLRIAGLLGLLLLRSPGRGSQETKSALERPEASS